MNKISFFSLILFGLFPCLAAAESEPSATPGDPTGLEGAIVAGPVRGGPTRQGAPEAKPLVNMAFEVKSGSRVVTSFQTDDQGRFRVLLEPGHYTVVRKDYAGAVGSYGPFEVDISRGKMASVQWQCDTGLR